MSCFVVCRLWASWKALTLTLSLTVTISRISRQWSRTIWRIGRRGPQKWGTSTWISRPCLSGVPEIIRIASFELKKCFENIFVSQEKGPSFAKRKEWRYILRRICQFLRSVDYLIQEFLHRVVKTSVIHLSDYVSKSTNTNVETKNKHKLKSDSFIRYLF